MRTVGGIVLALLTAWTPSMGHAQAKPAHDILDVCRARGGCQLTGVGLVVGLKETGDDFAACPQTVAALSSVMLRLGLSRLNSLTFKKNVAMVSVTTEVGDKASNVTPLTDRTTVVYVSPMCNAGPLSGGTLLMTGLLGADGQVYGVGQGKLSNCTDKTGVQQSCVVGGGAIF